MDVPALWPGYRDIRLHAAVLAARAAAAAWWGGKDKNRLSKMDAEQLACIDWGRRPDPLRGSDKGVPQKALDAERSTRGLHGLADLAVTADVFRGRWGRNRRPELCLRDYQGCQQEFYRRAAQSAHSADLVRKFSLYIGPWLQPDLNSFPTRWT